MKHSEVWIVIALDLMMNWGKIDNLKISFPFNHEYCMCVCVCVCLYTHVYIHLFQSVSFSIILLL